MKQLIGTFIYGLTKTRHIMEHSSKTERAMRPTVFYRLFRAHGQFCASRPWEVIIGTLMLTVCVMSMSLFSGNRKVCGWNTRCADREDDTKSSDVIILTITRCLAVIYLYLQFSKLRRLGPKYLLVIASVLTIVTSFVLSVGIANILGSDLTGLNEALPFFLLLIDLSKACTMARFALSSQDEVVDNIGSGMAVIGPQMTLDTVVETLVIGIGMLSRIKTLETMCCFGCLSVITNYLAFIIFYPACLALVLELTRGSRPLLQVQQLAKLWEEEEEKPNPVAQRVKVIMCAGLVFVYAQSRLVVMTSDDGHQVSKVAGLPPDLSQVIVPDVPIWRFYLAQCCSMSIDYILMLLLTFVLAMKYVVIDRTDGQTNKSLHLPIPPSSNGFMRVDAENKRRELAVRESKSVDEDQIDLDTPDRALPRDEVEVPKTDKLTVTLSGKQLAKDSRERVIKEDEWVLTPVEDESKDVTGSRFIVGDSSSDDDEIAKVTVGTQTSDDVITEVESLDVAVTPRSLEKCRAILKSHDGTRLTDDEVLMLVKSRDIPAYKLESILADYERGVKIRRRTITQYLTSATAVDCLPYTNYDYKYVDGACCENVIGYVPVPVGYAGPLHLNGKKYVVPMATTEGCLVASTNRGCRALSSGGGVRAFVTRDGMTRAPVVRFESASRAFRVKEWLEDKDNFDLVAETFSSTSRHARLKCLDVAQCARNLYIRFTASTGDAMGMNMLSKGTERVLTMLQENFFPDMEVISLSGNYCTDKKPSAVNWIKGRGKSVIAEAVVPRDVIKNVLKTSAPVLVDLNISKNLVGSAVAGSIGGFNAHAANIVTAIFIATGQDPAQNVSSSNCMTYMELAGPDDEDLYICCTMPSIEVGTIGGGTILPPQASCLEILGVRGSNSEKPGQNAHTLAEVVCAAVLASELSLMSALAAGDLVKSHMKHNRSGLITGNGFNESLVKSDVTDSGTCIRTAP